MRLRLALLASILFAALPAFAHGEQALYPFIAAGIIVPIVFVIRAAWFNGRGTVVVLAGSALLGAGLVRLTPKFGCSILFAPSIATLFVSAVVYQFDFARSAGVPPETDGHSARQSSHEPPDETSG